MSLEYRHDYLLAHIDDLDAGDHRAVSARFPLSFEVHDLENAPAFLIDLIPQGEARRWLVSRDVPDTDWDLLLHGARNPVGNLRIGEAAVGEAAVGEAAGHSGVDRAEVIRRGDQFLEWAEQHDIPMVGASDTLGAAPKLLLTEDGGGLLHAEGVLPDARAHQHYLVKYPRGKHSTDTLILSNEAPYLEVLRALGLRCGEPLSYAEGTLFIPRFDRRRVDGAVERAGLESLYSLLGIVTAGAAVWMEDAAAALAEVVDDPHTDLVEFILRDAAAMAMGNTDNHGRNTSIVKPPEGGSALSPIYDFAPMFLDRDVIKRTLRWRSEPAGEPPDWEDVCSRLEPLLPGGLLRPKLRDFGERLAVLPQIMAGCGVDAEIIARRQHHIAAASAGLCAVRGA